MEAWFPEDLWKIQILMCKNISKLHLWRRKRKQSVHDMQWSLGSVSHCSQKQEFYVAIEEICLQK